MAIKNRDFSNGNYPFRQSQLCIFVVERCNHMSISVENLLKVYGDQVAVDQLSFTVEPGEILGFLGPNGAGKSTTLKILAGYLQPTEGKVLLDGYSLPENAQEARKILGYLPEHNPLYLDMYVHEFLRFVCKLHSIKAKERNQRVKQIIQKTGLEKEQHKKIRELSKGYRQRVGLAQALIHDPHILVLDEPTTGLDPNQLIEIRQLIQELGKNKTVIFSSHLLSEVEAVAHRVLILNKGKLQANEYINNRESGSEDSRTVLLELELNKEGFDPERIASHSSWISTNAQGPCTWLIEVQNLEGIRELIFQECVRQNLVVFGLRQSARSLEDIFTQFTQDS